MIRHQSRIFRRNNTVYQKMRRLAFCLGCGMLLMASSVLAQSGFDKGAAAYKRGDFETALAVFRPLAENGDARAQSILGLMYSYGEGVTVAAAAPTPYHPEITP